MHRVQRIVKQLAPNGVIAKFEDVKVAPPNEIFNTKYMFDADKDPKKVNLGIGAYRDDKGNPYVLAAVIEAEKRILQSLAEGKTNHEYLAIPGDPDFCRLAGAMLYGANSPVIKEKRVAVVQAISGTGALRLASEFIARFLPGAQTYISAPTWENHRQIWIDTHLPAPKTYRYWDAKNRKLDFAGLIEDISAAPSGSVILLHACAHNPTGVDPTQAQWKEISKIMLERNLVPLFDSAYQGFASGDLDRDAWAVRYFVDQGHTMLACQSFAKNMGLYGERIGSFSVVAPNQKTAEALASQIAIYVRTLYSNPPAQGARIVKTILGDAQLNALWDKEMKMMANRIADMRQALYAELKRLGTPGTWEHVTSQIGMFSYLGVSEKQVELMTKKWHIYLLKSGRISMAGINPSNVKHVAAGIDDAVRNA